MLKPQIVFPASDLAPGDRRFAALDLGALRFDRVRSAADPLFEEAYGHLWLEFGKKHGMESRQTLIQRFQQAPQVVYEMIYVRREDDFVAVRDHTAILARDGNHTVVHLSHNLVAPKSRRTGLAGWMRSIPITVGRECLAANGMKNGQLSGPDSSARITLVAEMEYLSSDDPSCMIRLRAYEKAGFRKVDPTRIAYHQPDFRSSTVIDSTGGPSPLPFQLIIRRVGREHERVISGKELRTLVQGLYDIYGAQFRPADMEHPLLSLEEYPADDSTIALVPPTQ